MEVTRNLEHKGWEIRDDDQAPGSGTIITDQWLKTFGFGPPTRSNIDQIMKATMANQGGYAATKVDLRDHLGRRPD
jgi:hypothetical protein